eukprot:3870627-Amphidinium_carterae.1
MIYDDFAQSLNRFRITCGQAKRFQLPASRQAPRIPALMLQCPELLLRWVLAHDRIAQAHPWDMVCCTQKN